MTQRPVFGERQVWSSASRWPGRLALLVGCAVALAFASATVQPDGRVGVALDDTWIHLAFARTFVETGRWALTEQAPTSSGVTGYLWTALLALQMALGLGAAPAAVFSGAACLLGLGFVWWRIVRVALEDDRLASVSVCGLMLCGNLAYLAVTGMEAVPLLFAALLALERAAARDWRGSALAAAAAALLRPEGCLAGGTVTLMVLAGWLAPAPRSRQDEHEGPSDPETRTGEAPAFRCRARGALRAAAPPLLGLAMLFTLNLSTGGELMPNTYQGRRWLANLPERISLSPVSLASEGCRLAREWWEDLRDFTFGLAFAGYGGHGAGQVVDAHVAAAWILLDAVGLFWGLFFCRAPALRGTLVYAALHNLAYVLMLPTPGPAGRYQPVNCLLAAALPAVGAGSLARWLEMRWPSSGARRPLVALAVLLLLPAALNCRIWGIATSRAARQLETVHAGTARWGERYLPRDARLAAYDIGALAFHSRRAVVDFGGLTDPSVTRALHAARLLPMLRERGATHLVLPVRSRATSKQMLATFGLFTRRGETGPRVEMELLVRFSILPDPLWYHHLVGSTDPTMEVYRLRWND